MAEVPWVTAALRRDRTVVICALLGVVVLSWLYLLGGAGMSMHEMGGMLMPMRKGPWTLGYAGIVLVMWAVMMAAMMLPSAAPMLLLFTTISRRNDERVSAASRTSYFGLGYIAVWASFSGVAVILQYGLEQLSLVSPMMETTSVVFASAILIGAGIYQFTPLKRTCLRACRSPLEFLTAHWRAGTPGAFRMGVHHGAYCLGCCWVMMLLLFVGGVMNLAWVGGIALYVLIEKVAPAGEWISRGVGLVLVLWGIATALVNV